MPPPVEPTLIRFPAPAPKKSPISWFMVILGCLYFLCLAVAFTRAIPHLTKLYGDPGAALPLPTRILLSTHSWFPPIIFTAAAILTLAKKLAHFTTRQLRVLNIVLLVLGVVLPALFVWFLYSPLFGFIGKLTDAH